jgi:hypothetical protein
LPWDFPKPCSVVLCSLTGSPALPSLFPLGALRRRSTAGSLCLLRFTSHRNVSSLAARSFDACSPTPLQGTYSSWRHHPRRVSSSSSYTLSASPSVESARSLAAGARVASRGRLGTCLEALTEFYHRSFAYVPWAPELEDPSVCGKPSQLKTSELAGKKVVLVGVPGGTYCFASRSPAASAVWSPLADPITNASGSFGPRIPPAFTPTCSGESSIYLSDDLDMIPS